MESIFQQTAFYASTAPPPYMSPAAYIDQQHPTYRQQAAAAPYSAPWQPYPAVTSAAANGVRHQDDAVSSGWSSPSPAIGSWSYSPPLLPPPPSHANMYRGQRSYCCSATTSCSQSHAMPPAASMPSPLAVAPIQQRPKLTTTLWEDQGTLCYQVDAKNICVARRQDNDEINGTKLLNVVGMSRGKRDGILKNEKDRVVIKVGAMHLKGVWIKFERAQELAKKFKVYDLLYPLFEKNPQDFISTQPSSAESTPTVAPTQADSTITDGTASGGTPYKADAYGYMPSNWDHRPYHSILRSQPATPAAAAAYSQVQCSPVPSATAPIPQQQDEYLSATLATGPMNNVPELPTNAHANLYPPFDGNDSFKSSRNREDAEQETHSEGSVEQPSKPVSNNNKRKRASVDDNDEPTDKKNNNGNSSRSPKRNRSGQ